MSVSSRLRKLDSLLNAEDDVKWQIGDLLVQLIDGDGKSLKEIAQRYAGHPGRSGPRLSQYYSTAKMFPHKATRKKNVPYAWYDETRNSIPKVQKSVAKQLPGSTYKINPLDAIDAVVRGNNRKSMVKGGARNVTRVLAKHVAKQIMPSHRARTEKTAKYIEDNCTGIINNCHHSDYTEILVQMPVNSIRLAHLDPPYIGYRYKHLTLGTSTVARGACDNAQEKDAIATTCSAFSLLEPRLTVQGAIILWQSGDGCLHRDIQDAINDSRLVVSRPFIWWKKSPLPGNNQSPNMLSTEFAYLIHRKGEELINLDGSSRDQVHSLANDRQRAHSLTDDRHEMEKPAWWNEFFLGKFTMPGDVVFDAFGCSGAMAMAAMNLGRRWVHCESNAENFSYGQARIAEALQKFERSNIAAA